MQVGRDDHETELSLQELLSEGL